MGDRMSEEGIARRTASRRIAVAALLPFAALSARPLAASTLTPLPVPNGIFRLERVLSRGLGDGNAIVVMRQWRMVFARSGPGLSVSGEQTSAEVAAPPSLAPLAALERARSASGMFPIALDAAGLIVAGGEEGDSPQLVRAFETARALFASLPHSPDQQEDAKAFIANLARMSASAVSQLPRDLFFPQSGAETSSQAIALPGGDVGTITVTASATAAADSGLLMSSRRQIVTRVHDSERTASEAWSLVVID